MDDIEKEKTVMGYPSMAINNQYIALQNQIGHDGDANSTTFNRYITTFMLILIIAMVIGSIFMWMMFGKDKPQFHVTSLQVPTGLMITRTSMLGNWQVNVSMKNSNNDIDIKVNQGKVAIFYETNLLAENNVDPFDLGGHSSVLFFANLTTSPGTFLENEILTKANRSRNDAGVLKFALQINMGYEYNSKTESKPERIRVYCNDVKVQFGPKGEGELIKDENVDCIGNII